MLKTISKVTGIAWLAFTLVSSAAWAGSEKISSDLQSTSLPDRLDVIIQYKVPPTDANHQRVAKAGGALRDRLNVIAAAHYSIPRSALATLSDDPDVAFITPNRALKGMLDITAGAVHSDVANALGFRGTGIGVAVIDSGIAEMPDFQNTVGRIVYAASFVSGGAGDLYGHGTHVAGII